MINVDKETEAAIRHLLKGEGKSRSGTFLVTIHGGRIVAIAPIGGKLAAKDLSEQQGQHAAIEEPAPIKESAKERAEIPAILRPRRLAESTG